MSLAKAAAASSSAGIIIGTDFESGLGDDDEEVIFSRWSRSNPFLLNNRGRDAIADAAGGTGEDVREMDWKVSIDCEDVVEGMDCGVLQSEEWRGGGGGS